MLVILLLVGLVLVQPLSRCIVVVLLLRMCMHRSGISGRSSSSGSSGGGVGGEGVVGGLLPRGLWLLVLVGAFGGNKKSVEFSFLF